MPHPVHYLPQEIRSYLPTGWNLPHETGSFNAKTGKWSMSVLDGAENDWQLEVDVKISEKLGRMPALRAAMDRVYRQALG
jgi:hypothetical protein